MQTVHSSHLFNEPQGLFLQILSWLRYRDRLHGPRIPWGRPGVQEIHARAPINHYSQAGASSLGPPTPRQQANIAPAAPPRPPLPSSSKSPSVGHRSRALSSSSKSPSVVHRSRARSSSSKSPSVGHRSRARSSSSKSVAAAAAASAVALPVQAGPSILGGDVGAVLDCKHYHSHGAADTAATGDRGSLLASCLGHMQHDQRHSHSHCYNNHQDHHRHRHQVAAQNKRAELPKHGVPDDVSFQTHADAATAAAATAAAAVVDVGGLMLGSGGAAAVAVAARRVSLEHPSRPCELSYLAAAAATAPQRQPYGNQGVQQQPFDPSLPPPPPPPPPPASALKSTTAAAVAAGAVAGAALYHNAPSQAVAAVRAGGDSAVLSAAIRASASLDELADLYDTQPGAFRSGHVSAALVRLPHLAGLRTTRTPRLTQPRHEALLQHLLTRYEVHRAAGEYGTRDLSSCAWVLGTLGRREQGALVSELAGHMLALRRRHMVQQYRTVEAAEAVSAATAVAGDRGDGGDGDVMRELLEESSDRRGRMRCWRDEQLGSGRASPLVARAGPTTAVDAVAATVATATAKVAAAAMAAAPPGRASNCTPLDLSNMALGMAKAGVTSPSLWMQLTEAAAAKRLGDFGTQETTNFAWSLAQAHRELCRREAAGAAAATAAATGRRAMTGAAIDAGNIEGGFGSGTGAQRQEGFAAWPGGYGCSSAPPPAAARVLHSAWLPWARTFVDRILAPRVRCMLRRYTAQQAANVAWALAALGHANGRTLAAVAAAAEAAVKVTEATAQAGQPPVAAAAAERKEELLTAQAGQPPVAAAAAERKEVLLTAQAGQPPAAAAAAERKEVLLTAQAGQPPVAAEAAVMRKGVLLTAHGVNMLVWAMATMVTTMRGSSTSDGVDSLGGYGSSNISSSSTNINSSHSSAYGRGSINRSSVCERVILNVSSDSSCNSSSSSTSSNSERLHAASRNNSSDTGGCSSSSGSRQYVGVNDTRHGYSNPPFPCPQPSPAPPPPPESPPEPPPDPDPPPESPPRPSAAIHPRALMALTRFACARMDRFSAQGLSNLMWGLGVLGFRSPSQLLHLATHQALLRLPTMQPLTLATLLEDWARARRYHPGLFAAAAPRAVALLRRPAAAADEGGRGGIRPRTLARLLRAYGAVGHADWHLFMAAASVLAPPPQATVDRDGVAAGAWQRCAGRSAAPLDELSPAELYQLVIAYGRVGVHAPRLMDELLARLAPVLAAAARLPPSSWGPQPCDAGRLLCALAVLDHRPAALARPSSDGCSTNTRTDGSGGGTAVATTARGAFRALRRSVTNGLDFMTSRHALAAVWALLRLRAAGAPAVLHLAQLLARRAAPSADSLAAGLAAVARTPSVSSNPQALARVVWVLARGAAAARTNAERLRTVIAATAADGGTAAAAEAEAATTVFVELTRGLLAITHGLLVVGKVQLQEEKGGPGAVPVKVLVVLAAALAGMLARAPGACGDAVDNSASSPAVARLYDKLRDCIVVVVDMALRRSAAAATVPGQQHRSGRLTARDLADLVHALYDSGVVAAHPAMRAAVARQVLYRLQAAAPPPPPLPVIQGAAAATAGLEATPTPVPVERAAGRSNSGSSSSSPYRMSLSHRYEEQQHRHRHHHQRRQQLQRHTRHQPTPAPPPPPRLSANDLARLLAAAARLELFDHPLAQPLLRQAIGTLVQSTVAAVVAAEGVDGSAVATAHTPAAAAAATVCGSPGLTALQELLWYCRWRGDRVVARERDGYGDGDRSVSKLDGSPPPGVGGGDCAAGPAPPSASSGRTLRRALCSWAARQALPLLPWLGAAARARVFEEVLPPDGGASDAAGEAWHA